MKTILMILGDKGGVGKTVVTRLIYDYLKRKNVSIAAYDCDKRNAQFVRHYGKRDADGKLMGQTPLDGVARIDIFDPVGLGSLLDDLESAKPDFAVIDMPAGGHGQLEKTEQTFAFCESAKSLGYEVVLVHVLSRVKDSAHALTRLINFFGDKVSYLVVKNGFFGDADKFTRFETGPAKEALERQNGAVLYLPDLYDTILDIVDEHNLTFSEAKKSTYLPFSLRQMAATWMNRFDDELEKAGM